MDTWDIVDVSIEEGANDLTALDFLMELKWAGMILWSQERGNRPASNSEMRRWLTQGAILINGKRPKMNDKIEFPVTELVLFPNGKKHKCSIF